MPHPLSMHPEDGPTSLARYRTILCDLDGCLISSGSLLPGASEFVGSEAERLWIVSNNSTDTPHTMASRMARLGLVLPPERWVLAGAELIRSMVGQAKSSAVVADPPLQTYARELGLKLDDRQPQTVILCRYQQFSFSDLARIIVWLERGADLLVANPDPSHPGDGGVPVPETGALLASILAIRPHQAFTVFGKPEPILFKIALNRAEALPSTAVMIGDNPQTDARGAMRLGITFIQTAPNAGVAHLARDQSTGALEC